MPPRAPSRHRMCHVQGRLVAQCASRTLKLVPPAPAWNRRLPLGRLPLLLNWFSIALGSRGTDATLVIFTLMGPKHKETMSSASDGAGPNRPFHVNKR